MGTVRVSGVEREAERGAGKISIILSKGSLDMAYPAFIIAQAAAAMGMEVHVFVTFWGFDAIRKDRVNSLKLSPVGNTSLGMPNVLAVLPGMTALATKMMRKRMAKHNVPDLYQLIKQAKEMGVKIHACSTTMAVLGLKESDLIPEVDDVVGAATFLQLSEGGQVIFI
ncbi:MAG: DsrE/DsrF/DrsH-like family protein [Thaumarchaeota archaeon]|nr:DsrE/DsrF/DrsH-like family protein [Candidatus Calditenuaceae archaeon]MCX8203963.1 DsrE/DsrF/DrsH-like family protein [Nitrososphaeria archaeon]MDW8042835.1 DsrE/DsrF/DrsH-like family protein [Nitrososphaerota archaeon]